MEAGGPHYLFGKGLPTLTGGCIAAPMPVLVSLWARMLLSHRVQ